LFGDEQGGRVYRHHCIQRPGQIGRVYLHPAIAWLYRPVEITASAPLAQPQRAGGLVAFQHIADVHLARLDDQPGPPHQPGPQHKAFEAYVGIPHVFLHDALGQPCQMERALLAEPAL
jgi:hypothetical protein